MLKWSALQSSDKEFQEREKRRGGREEKPNPFLKFYSKSHHYGSWYSSVSIVIRLQARQLGYDSQQGQ
jgi:hypothetical protein